MSAWDTESGLEEKYTGKVTDAFFDEGQYGPVLKLSIESPELGGVTEVWYNCGKGVRLVSDTEVDLSLMKGQKFNSNSAVGQLIEYLKATPELVDLVAAQGDPSSAKSYIGLAAVWERIEFKAKINGEDVEYTRVLPTASLNGGNDEVEVPRWLVDLCVEHSTYDEFVSAALEDDRLDGDSRKLVLNESYWDFG